MGVSDWATQNLMTLLAFSAVSNKRFQNLENNILVLICVNVFRKEFVFASKENSYLTLFYAASWQCRQKQQQQPTDVLGCQVVSKIMSAMLS